MMGLHDPFFLIVITCLTSGALSKSTGDGSRSSVSETRQAASSHQDGWIDRKLDLYDVAHGKDDEGLARYSLTQKTAKTLLTRNPRRVCWWECKKEERRRRARVAERDREEHLAQICPQSCWGSWAEYGECSIPCGRTGQRFRYRTPSPSAVCAEWVATYGCAGTQAESQECNQWCYNDGTLLDHFCLCPPSHTGICCETVVTCGHPGKPQHGDVSLIGERHLYGTVAHYHCQQGYIILSEARWRTCQSSGEWTGALPTCSLITCAHPGVPTNGAILGGFSFNEEVTFSCHAGFILQGDASRRCQENGEWSGTQPTCGAVSCGIREQVENGRVSQHEMAYPEASTVTECNPGFYVSGYSVATCRTNGDWSHPLPDCMPCHPGTYKEDLGGATSCHPCPAHSSTDSLACTSSLDCRCDLGYEGLNGGPCEAMMCERLTPGSHTQALDCDLEYGHVCSFVCEWGYVATSGTANRECLQNKRWSGTDLICTEASYPGVEFSTTILYSTDCCECISFDLAEMEYYNLLEREVCNIGASQCDIQNIVFECENDGSYSYVTFPSKRRRRRRSAGDDVQITFEIHVNAKRQLDVDCQDMCEQSDSSSYCLDTCLSDYVDAVIQSLQQRMMNVLSSGSGEDVISLDDNITLYATLPPSFSGASTKCESNQLEFDGICGVCPAGMFLSEEECVGCPAGSYQPESGQMKCKQCHPGTYQSERGQASCSPCPAGTFQQDEGQTNCSQCPSGTFQQDGGQTNCSQCPSGTFQHDGQTNCTQRPPETFRQDDGQINCSRCPPGTFPQGQINSTPSPTGTFQQDDGQTNCSQCPPGSFQQDKGQSNCSSCPPGTFQQDEGQPNCTHCFPGTFHDEGQTNCTRCPSGISQQDEGRPNCTLCCPGILQQDGGQPNCTLCFSEISQQDEGPTNCPPGIFQRAEGQTNCTQCPPGNVQFP